MDLTKARAVASEVYAQRYGQAAVVLLAGSFVRGDATAHSDLDLVVVHERVVQAGRTAFYHAGWPVEVFEHDPQTLAYFFHHVDRPTGVPSLADMVAFGVAVTQPNEITSQIKALAHQILEEGPPPWQEAEVRASRYGITDMVDDLRAPRGVQEARATLVRLYPALADHYFRTRGMWAAKGKAIPRKLAQADPALAQRFDAAFAVAFGMGQMQDVIGLATDLLAPEGGLLFEGYTRLAPKDWRAGER